MASECRMRTVFYLLAFASALVITAACLPTDNYFDFFPTLCPGEFLGPCLHEVASGDGLADVGVVLARVEVRGDQPRAQPRRYPHLRSPAHTLQHTFPTPTVIFQNSPESAVIAQGLRHAEPLNTTLLPSNETASAHDTTAYIAEHMLLPAKAQLGHSGGYAHWMAAQKHSSSRPACTYLVHNLHSTTKSMTLRHCRSIGRAPAGCARCRQP